MKDEMQFVTLYDENGEAVEFEIITRIEIEDKEYFIVVPKDEEVEEAIALRVEVDEDEEEVLVPVEEENELMMVSEAYEMLFDEE